jgi:MFS family permease
MHQLKLVTKTTEASRGTDPWSPASRRNKCILFASIAIIAVILIAGFALDYSMGWLSKRQNRILDVLLFLFLFLYFAYFKIIQVRHYRRIGQERIGMGPFKISRWTFEVQSIGFFTAITSAFITVLAIPIPDEIIRPIFIGGMVVFIAGFASAIGSSFSSSFATLGVLLSAGGALYNALAGTDFTRPITQSIIYAGIGLVAVAVITFFIDRSKTSAKTPGSKTSGGK